MFCKFTGEHHGEVWFEIALRHGCSPVNLLHIFRTLFYKNTTGWLLLNKGFFTVFIFFVLLLCLVTFISISADLLTCLLFCSCCCCCELFIVFTEHISFLIFSHWYFPRFFFYVSVNFHLFILFLISLQIFSFIDLFYFPYTRGNLNNWKLTFFY